MMRARIRRVIVEEKALGYGDTRSILEAVGDLPKSVAESRGDKTCGPGHGEMNMGKDTLHLLAYKGDFLKPCPGTREYLCCGYQILNVGTNCPLNCSYCILQAYFNQPNLRIHVNLREEIGRVFQAIDRNPHKIFRVGTGEFIDSLALDGIAGWNRIILPGFSKRKNCVIELKTKTTNTRSLLESEHRDRIIVSWSLNSPFVCAREEQGAAGLKARLEAARECQSGGFTVGFHFDPLIYHKDWREGYRRTIDLLDRYVDPRGIIWISLGSLRFMPALKPIIRRRHPQTTILDGEFVLGLDGKMRYFKPMRIDLYAFLMDLLNGWHPDLGLYLCMESNEVWQESMGWSPETSGGLSAYLDRRVAKRFSTCSVSSP